MRPRSGPGGTTWGLVSSVEHWDGGGTPGRTSVWEGVDPRDPRVGVERGTDLNDDGSTPPTPDVTNPGPRPPSSSPKTGEGGVIPDLGTRGEGEKKINNMVSVTTRPPPFWGGVGSWDPPPPPSIPLYRNEEERHGGHFSKECTDGLANVPEPRGVGWESPYHPFPQTPPPRPPRDHTSAEHPFDTAHNVRTQTSRPRSRKIYLAPVLGPDVNGKGPIYLGLSHFQVETGQRPFVHGIIRPRRRLNRVLTEEYGSSAGHRRLM